MSLINKLTDAQKALFPEYVEKWTKLGLSCEPSDFDRAAAAFKELYQAIGVGWHGRVIRVSSPIVGAFAAPISANIFFRLKKHIEVASAVDSEVGSAIDSAVYSAVSSAVDIEVRSAVAIAIDSAVYSAVASAVDIEVRGAVASAVGSAVASEVRSAVASEVASAVASDKLFWHSWFGGSFWMGYISWFSYIEEVLGVSIPNIGENYRTIAIASGYAWANRDFLILCDRPKEINRDDQGRLHSETGMSISYRDGWGLFHFHGVQVPEQVIMRPETLTTDQIETEGNAEVRRVMIERYGLERFLLDSGAMAIHSDDFGTLYRKEIPGD